MRPKEQVWSWAHPVEVFGGVRLPEGILPHLEHGPALLVTSAGARARGWLEPLERAVRTRCTDIRTIESVRSNPTLEALVEAGDAQKGFCPVQVVAIGGGSVLDFGKTLAYLLAPGAPTPSALASALREGRPVADVTALPWVGIPTTAGTGSEATPFATLWDSGSRRKLSFSHPSLFARRALLDPRMTLKLPWPVTLSTGLDTLSQCLESVWNVHGSPFTDALAASGAAAVLRFLPLLRKQPESLPARSALQLASFQSGLCISRTRTALAHSVSYPLTAHLGTPHGLACSFTLPELWAFNLAANDGRMENLAKALAPDSPEPGREAGFRLEQFLDGLGFAYELRKTVPSADAVLALEAEMITPGRADNNLRPLAPGDLRGILERSLARWIPS